MTFCLSSPLRRLAEDLSAVAEDRHDVRDLQHIVDEVRNEDDASAGVAQPAQHFEQVLDLGRRESRGRLVENDDARPGKQDPADLDELLQADR